MERENMIDKLIDAFFNDKIVIFSEDVFGNVHYTIPSEPGVIYTLEEKSQYAVYYLAHHLDMYSLEQDSDVIDKCARSASSIQTFYNCAQHIITIRRTKEKKDELIIKAFDKLQRKRSRNVNKDFTIS